jgi:hypothetical protein
MATRSLETPKIEAKLSATNKNTLTDSSVTSIGHPSLNYTKKLTSGIGSMQANRSWQSLDRALANGASEDIDLYDFGSIDIGAGAGLDGLGQSMALLEIAAIAIVNTTVITSPALIEVYPAETNGWTPIGQHTVTRNGAIPAQGLLMKTSVGDAGYAVTDASNHVLTIRAQGAGATYSIYVMGRDDTDESSSSSISTSSSSQSGSSSSNSSSVSSSSSLSSLSSSSSSG